MVRIAGAVAAGTAALAVLATIGWFVMSQPWSSGAAPKPPRDEFASDRGPAPVTPVAFDAKRAMGYLEDICKLGPRVSGTEAMKKQQELLQKHFETHGAKVELQRFTVRQVSERRPVEMANLIAAWHPEQERRVIVCAHYDTRPIADQEPDPRKWRAGFLGANDGGSGVALLMELAHHMKGLKTSIGVDFVLFDGEEYILDPQSDRFFFGSDHFGQVYKAKPPKHRYLGAVLVDMVAGKNARFPIEGYSRVQAGALVEEVWAIAAELKCTAFVNRPGDSVQDDHLALNRAGIPAIDIIDFSYPHWHRLSDTPANCSGEPMEQVGRVVSVWLQRVK